MTGEDADSGRPGDPSGHWRVDRLCDDFEAAWRAGRRPSIEAHLEPVDVPDRRLLFRELLDLELEYRRHRGEQPDEVEYLRRFPEFSESIRRAFSEMHRSSQAFRAEDPSERFGRGTEETLAERPLGRGIDALAPDQSPANGSLPYYDLLKTTPPFSQLTSVVVRAVLDGMQQREYAPGDALIRQHEPSRGLTVVVEGTVEVHVEEDDRCHTITRSEGALTLGEMSLVTGEPCTATVIAQTPVKALLLSSETFQTLAVKHSVLCLALNRLIADRLGRESVDSLVGKVVHGFRIRRPIGRGGMAVVYEAEDLSNGRTVALKMMSHRLTHDLEAQTRFEREAEICRRLRHPNILQVYDHFAAFGTCFIVVEHCRGATLTELIRQRGRLAEDEVRGLLGQLASALAYLHGRGVLHRDLKPSNVMIDDRGTLKLMDFGLAKSAVSPALTSAGTLLGTPRYMAPEQLAGGEVDARTDVFALGCVAWEMITGETLFQQSDLIAILSEQIRWRLPPAEVIRPGLAGDLYDLLRRSLARDPRRRTQDLNRLAEWAQQQPGLLC